MTEEFVDIVDEEDKVVGKATREEADRKDLRRRVSRILVFNKEENMLIQKRADTKSKYPGLYDIGVGETLNSGEDFESAATRGLEEEVGIKNAELNFLFSGQFTHGEIKRNYHVYLCVHDGEIKAGDEVSEARFVRPDELKQLFEKEEFVPLGKKIFEEFLKNG
ncbi:MAG: NUDIX domain-containing protein [bacterium]|nr:NUDIX domain-containing protein [bacterium]